MTKLPRVSIIAGGYLGSRLADKLIEQKYSVKVSFRSNAPKPSLNSVEYQHCEVSNGVVTAQDSLFDCDCLVICIPPGFKKGMGDFYAPGIEALLKRAQSQGVNHVIYTSSIGIYPQAGVFDELSDLSFDNSKSKVLRDAECRVLDSRVKNKHVLRLAGLIGEGRHPGDFRVSLDKLNHDGRANLVMIDDVVDAIAHLISKPDTDSLVYNLCASHTPSKQSVYRYAKQLKGIETPSPMREIESAPKRRIDGERICRETEFRYQHRNLFKALQSL